ncbi:MAG: MFS transporter [Proteobacteria bacterium]|nr:MFS transporter [Pseudomonadota bacterium]
MLLLLTFGLPRGQPFVASPRHASFSWRRCVARAMILAAGWLAARSRAGSLVVVGTRSRARGALVPVRAAASLAKMAIAMPAGIVSDRLGRIPVLLGGWTLRVLVLLLLAALPAPPAWQVWLLFIAYAVTLAVTEPAERSVIGDHASAPLAKSRAV